MQNNLFLCRKNIWKSTGKKKNGCKKKSGEETVNAMQYKALIGQLPESPKGYFHCHFTYKYKDYHFEVLDNPRYNG